mgnify:FL=1
MSISILRDYSFMHFAPPPDYRRRQATIKVLTTHSPAGRHIQRAGDGIGASQRTRAFTNERPFLIYVNGRSESSAKNYE